MPSHPKADVTAPGLGAKRRPSWNPRATGRDPRRSDLNGPAAAKECAGFAGGGPAGAQKPEPATPAVPLLRVVVQSAFLESGPEGGEGSGGSRRGEESGGAYAGALLRRLRSRHRVHARDAEAVPGPLHFLLGESGASGLLVVHPSACGDMASVRGLTRRLLSAALRCECLWLVVDLALARPQGPKQAKQERAAVEGPRLTVKAPKRLLVESAEDKAEGKAGGKAGGAATWLPSPAFSACLAHLSRSVWHFPCPVHVRYAWGADQVSALVRAAADHAAAQDALALEQPQDPAAVRGAPPASQAQSREAFEGSYQGGQGGQGAGEEQDEDGDGFGPAADFMARLPPLNAASAPRLLRAAGRRAVLGGGMTPPAHALAGLSGAHCLRALLGLSREELRSVGGRLCVSEERLDALFDTLHLELCSATPAYPPEGYPEAHPGSYSARAASEVYPEGGTMGEQPPLRPVHATYEPWPCAQVAEPLSEQPPPRWDQTARRGHPSHEAFPEPNGPFHREPSGHEVAGSRADWAHQEDGGRGRQQTGGPGMYMEPSFDPNQHHYHDQNPRYTESAGACPYPHQEHYQPDNGPTSYPHQEHYQPDGPKYEPESYHDEQPQQSFEHEEHDPYDYQAQYGSQLVHEQGPPPYEQHQSSYEQDQPGYGNFMRPYEEQPALYQQHSPQRQQPLQAAWQGQGREASNPALHWPSYLNFHHPPSASVVRGQRDKLGFKFDPAKRNGQTILYWSPKRKAN